MKNNRNHMIVTYLNDEMSDKLTFLSWAYSINKDKIIEDLLLAFKDCEILSTLNKRTTPINFFYATDRFHDKKYKVIYTEKGGVNEKKRI